MVKHPVCNITVLLGGLLEAYFKSNFSHYSIFEFKNDGKKRKKLQKPPAMPQLLAQYLQDASVKSYENILPFIYLLHVEAILKIL